MKSTYLNTPKTANNAVIREINRTMTKNRINHAKKYVLSYNPIIFIPSLAFDSFSKAIFETR